MNHKTTTAGLLVLTLVAVACGGGGGGTASSPTGPSAGGSSHNAGRDCLSCHNFTVAGTVYAADGTTPRAGAVVRLTSGPGGTGTTVLSLTSDGSGNFYTTSPVSFGSGLHTDATGPSGATRSMQASITRGGCNACHASGNRVVVG